MLTDLFRFLVGGKVEEEIEVGPKRLNQSNFYSANIPGEARLGGLCNLFSPIIQSRPKFTVSDNRGLIGMVHQPQQDSCQPSTKEG